MPIELTQHFINAPYPSIPFPLIGGKGRCCDSSDYLPPVRGNQVPRIMHAKFGDPGVSQSDGRGLFTPEQSSEEFFRLKTKATKVLAESAEDARNGKRQRVKDGDRIIRHWLRPTAKMTLETRVAGFSRT